LTKGVAVYASPKDRALGVSEKLAGNSRLGRSVGKIEPFERKLLLSVPKIELVDASVAEKEFGSGLGHSYFFRDPWVSSDIGSFILGRTPVARGLVKKQADQVFWEFPTDYPEQLKQRIGAAPLGPAQRVSPEVISQYPAGHYPNQQYRSGFSNQLEPQTVAPQTEPLSETWEVPTNRAKVIEGLDPAAQLLKSQPWRAN